MTEEDLMSKKKVARHMEWLEAIKTMGHLKYWNKANTVEFIAFVVKAMIIFPGLLFGIQIWWFYIFAAISSMGLVWSSTKKTIPTLIWFNILWTTLAIFAIIKNFL